MLPSNQSTISHTGNYTQESLIAANSRLATHNSQPVSAIEAAGRGRLFGLEPLLWQVVGRTGWQLDSDETEIYTTEETITQEHDLSFLDCTHERHQCKRMT